MQINVTQQHIDNGIKSDCRLCPIALALLPLFTNLPIEVDSCCIEIGCCIGSDDIQYYSPDSVIKFITAFDSSFPVKPFYFELQEIT